MGAKDMGAKDMGAKDIGAKDMGAKESDVRRQGIKAVRAWEGKEWLHTALQTTPGGDTGCLLCRHRSDLAESRIMSHSVLCTERSLSPYSVCR